MANIHVTPNGPQPCHAQPGRCPYGSAEEHFHDQESAQAEYERRGEAMLNESGPLKKSPAKAETMSDREKTLAEQNKKLLQQIVELRSGSGDVTYDDADPDRAQRRLKEAIEYADSRNNTHLSSQLAKARVLPSGAFKTADGKRINTDSTLKSYVASKHIESERAAVIDAMTAAAREGDPQNKKFSFKNEAGSFSATISEGVDEEAFEKLPPKTRAACSSEKTSYSLDKAREVLTPAQLHEVTQRQQVTNYVVGKEPDVGQKSVKADRNLKGDTADEKIQSGLENLGSFYSESAKTYGKHRDLKAHVSEGSDAMKSVAAKYPGNTFAPARSQRNGALVTDRYVINSKKAKEMLTPEQLEAISTKSPKPDREKAAIALDADTFGKIFNARKVSVRATEAKD